MQTRNYFEKNWNTGKQAILFLAVGVVTLLIDVLVTNTMYSVLHVPAAYASAVGFLSGFVTNFPLNRKKVFNHGVNDRFSLRVQATLYALLSIFNLFMTSWLVGLLVTHDILHIQYAKILITGIFAIWNFLVFKFFIFSNNTNISDY